jgi:hypothetical protein
MESPSTWPGVRKYRRWLNGGGGEEVVARQSRLCRVVSRFERSVRLADCDPEGRIGNKEKSWEGLPKGVTWRAHANGPAGLATKRIKEGLSSDSIEGVRYCAARKTTQQETRRWWSEDGWRRGRGEREASENLVYSAA